MPDQNPSALPVDIEILLSKHNRASMDLADATTPDATWQAANILAQVRATLVATILRHIAPAAALMDFDAFIEALQAAGWRDTADARWEGAQALHSRLFGAAPAPAASTATSTPTLPAAGHIVLGGNPTMVESLRLTADSEGGEHD